MRILCSLCIWCVYKKGWGWWQKSKYNSSVMGICTHDWGKLSWFYLQFTRIIHPCLMYTNVQCINTCGVNKYVLVMQMSGVDLILRNLTHSNHQITSHHIKSHITLSNQPIVPISHTPCLKCCAACLLYQSSPIQFNFKSTIEIFFMHE